MAKNLFSKKSSYCLVIIILLLTGALLVKAFLDNKSNNLATIKSYTYQPKPAVNHATISSQPKPKQATPSTQAAQAITQQSGKQVRVPILMYHYIGNNPNPADKVRDSLSVTPDKFDAQMGYLAKAGYTPIFLDTMLAGLRGQISLPTKPVVISFDDGYVDLYYNAFPILRKYGFHAVVFIPTGLIGKSYYASWEQLAEMQSSGLLSFQAHSVNHSNLPSLSQDRLIFELTDSKKTLEGKFGIPVNFVAYPYGASNETVWQAVKKAGYLGALGTWYSPIISEGVIYNMPRVRIGGNFDLATFASRL